MSGWDTKATALISICITTIGPVGAATGVMEPGKFIAYLDLLCEGGARSSNQWVTFGEAKAVFGASELKVTYSNAITKDTSYPLHVFFKPTQTNFVVMGAIETPGVVHKGKFSRENAFVTLSRQGFRATASNTSSNHLHVRAILITLLEEGGLGMRDTVCIDIEGTFSIRSTSGDSSSGDGQESGNDCELHI